jgi:PAS domain S-box-containing protein
LHSLDDLPHIVAYSEHVGEALFAVDREWRVRAANRLALDFAHLTAERVIGRLYWDIGPPRGPITQTLRDAMANGTPIKFEFESEFRPESILCGVAIPLRDGLIVSFRDVTQERNLARSNEERLRTIANNIPNGMVYQMARAADGSVRFTYVSQAVERLHGLNAEAVLADPKLLDSQVLDEYRPQLDALRLSADRVTEVSTEIPMRVPSGEVRWFHRASACRRLPDGTTIWDGVEIDITEHRRAEAALRDSETRLKLALEAARMAVFEWNSATQDITPSPQLNRLLGFPPDYELTEKEARSLHLPSEDERLSEIARAALQNGERQFELEYQALGPGGQPRWFALRAQFENPRDGVPERVIGVLLDITTRRRAEEALREREAGLWNALEAASLATFEVDRRTRAVRSTPRLAEIYDYPPDRPLTVEDLRARCHPEDRSLIADQIARAAGSGQQRFELEFRLLLPDGTVRWVNGRGEWIRDEDGIVIGSRGVVLDISQRKHAEERQTLLVHELNHRVKNTLMTVQSLVNQTLRNAKGPGSAREDIEARLLALSRAHDVLTRESWEGADLADIVAEAIGPYRERNRSRFSISGPPIRLKPQAALALAMALQELATNAVKYGALSIEAGAVSVSWTVGNRSEEPCLQLNWTESGGPPVIPPARRGFGSRLIERSLAQQLDADVSMRFPASGLTCTIDAPL